MLSLRINGTGRMREARDLTSVALDRVCLAARFEVEHIVVIRLRDGRVDVEVVDDILGVVPPAR